MARGVETRKTVLGENRTGAAMHADVSSEMAEYANARMPEATVDGEALRVVREEYARDADPLGTVPPPSSIAEAAKIALKALKGDKPTLFTDKVGERIAFERTGTRLYQALRSKHDVFGSFEGGPQAEELFEIEEQERKHFDLLVEVMKGLGGDPTAVTPSADIQAVLSKGMIEVLSDPRTTFTQCLDAILTAELTDNDAWRALVDLANEADEPELARQFEDALAQEDEHLAKVRRWVAASLGTTVGPRASPAPARVTTRTRAEPAKRRGKSRPAKSRGAPSRSRAVTARASGGKARPSPAKSRTSRASRAKAQKSRRSR